MLDDGELRSFGILSETGLCARGTTKRRTLCFSSSGCSAREATEAAIASGGPPSMMAEVADVVDELLDSGRVPIIPGAFDDRTIAEMLFEIDAAVRLSTSRAIRLNIAFKAWSDDRWILTPESPPIHVSSVRSFVNARVLVRTDYGLQRLESAVGLMGLPSASEGVGAELAASLGRKISTVDGEARAGPFFGEVLLGGRAAATLIHETLGHGLEADNVLHGSVYATDAARPMIPRKLSVTDDPQISSAYGFIAWDDEGFSATSVRTVRESQICDLMGSYSTHLAGRGYPGRGRCASFRHPPLPRMTNIRVAGGEASEVELQAEVGDGAHIESFAAGSRGYVSGRCCLRADEAYALRAGTVTEPIRPFDVEISGLHTLARIVAVSRERRYVALNCGKQGQYVPVSVMAPAMLLTGASS